MEPQRIVVSIVKRGICYYLAPTVRQCPSLRRLSAFNHRAAFTKCLQIHSSFKLFVKETSFLGDSFVTMATGSVNTLTGYVHELATSSGEQDLITRCVNGMGKVMNAMIVRENRHLRLNSSLDIETLHALV